MSALEPGEIFAEVEEQARDYMRRNGTQPLVDELREAIEARRRVRLGTINTIILLAHIDALERVAPPEEQP